MLIHAGNYEPTSDFWLWNKSKLENKISTGSKYGTKTLNIKALINFELDLNKIQNFKRKEILVLWTHLKAQSSGDLILQVNWIEEEEAGKVKSNLLYLRLLRPSWDIPTKFWNDSALNILVFHLLLEEFLTFRVAERIPAPWCRNLYSEQVYEIFDATLVRSNSSENSFEIEHNNHWTTLKSTASISA